MKHIQILKNSSNSTSKGPEKDLFTRVTGRFYTHSFIARHLMAALLPVVPKDIRILRIIEPFCGDGRLVCNFLESLGSYPAPDLERIQITLWDCDEASVALAKRNVARAARRAGLPFSVEALTENAFNIAPARFGQFDVCITNPPWEVLKPDHRELGELTATEADKYVQLLREHDRALRQLYPLSAPVKRFSGWGTNLARCGVELSLRLLAHGGVLGIVSPSSLLADQMFEPLRTWLFSEHCLHDIALYVAEARLFDKVDQPSITFVASKSVQNGTSPLLSIYGKDLDKREIRLDPDEWRGLAKNGYVVPLQFGIELIKVVAKLGNLPRFGEFEGTSATGLWAGRELDETGYERFLTEDGRYLFLKGRMIDRYQVIEQPTLYVAENGPRIPVSADHERIVWRDVSRPNQRRRMHATIIPAGWVTGNSLSVAYFRDDSPVRLRALLAILNSFVFEAQIRSQLATSHISLGAVRLGRIPELSDKRLLNCLSALVAKCEEGEKDALDEIEIQVAKAYGLSHKEFALVLSSFPKVSADDRTRLCEKAELYLNRGNTSENIVDLERTVLIPNHYSASLSELDLLIAKNVPPGGNWKDIPTSVPSQRLSQIRESYAAGEGSRSTYYGRLRPEAPAYTINTYFSRPGNGCHLHYDSAQQRVLSQREAARLQSFPDAFVFLGSRNSINQQIGNAVPPLLAYQIARCFPLKGQFVDLFSGAGGLGLGFIWAGWTPLVANDISESFLQTYSRNCHPDTVCGDIREEAIFSSILDGATSNRKRGVPLFVLGGPPCQGFSTAGNKRSMSDQRNWLFRQYIHILHKLKPDGFVFENVTGLLNMEGGRVLEMVRSELLKEAREIATWKLRAEEHGIPQRRTRIVIVGTRTGTPPPPPPPTTHFGKQTSLFGQVAAVSVKEALSDLPRISPGEDGSHKAYVSGPTNYYQELMRGVKTPEEYVRYLNREWSQRIGA